LAITTEGSKDWRTRLDKAFTLWEVLYRQKKRTDTTKGLTRKCVGSDVYHARGGGLGPPAEKAKVFQVREHTGVRQGANYTKHVKGRRNTVDLWQERSIVGAKKLLTGVPILGGGQAEVEEVWYQIRLRARTIKEKVILTMKKRRKCGKDAVGGGKGVGG